MCTCIQVHLLLHLAVQPVNRSVESVWAVLLCQILRSPLTHGLSGSLGTETAAVPLHNSHAKPWTRPEEVWYHENQTRVTTGPLRTSLQQLIFPKPNSGHFKSKFFARVFTFSLAKKPFCSLSNSPRASVLLLVCVQTLKCPKSLLTLGHPLHFQHSFFFFFF